MKKKIVIVGGGSSGWMVAAYLNGAINRNGNKPKVEIELIESPDIPRISVGEATVLSIRHILSVVGISEIDFLKATDGSFKQSIKYVNWLRNDNSFYYHPFNRLNTGPIDTSVQQWLASDRSIPFVQTCSAQPDICELGLSPQMLGKWNMGAPFSYAYHMNAQKFADLLRDLSVKRGVKHTLANVTQVNLKDNGHIQSVDLDIESSVTGDLFVDCTGFKAKLIDEALNVGWEDCSQWLLCDRAIAMHIPYETYYPGMVRPYTTATALSNGWVWDIPMQNQRSIGYVHSSAFIDSEQAERELRNYQGGDIDKLESRTIFFKVGRRHQVWKGNCIAVGLSGGFIEPLESTGLYLSDLGAVMLAQHFPQDESQMKAMAFRYNRIHSNKFYEILDFINMHYCLTQRTDTEFWRTVQQEEHITDRLLAKFDFWKKKPPSPLDFEDQAFLGLAQSNQASHLTGGDIRPSVDTAGIWDKSNYQYILYSMEFEKRYGALPLENAPKTSRSPLILQRLALAKERLPSHEQWLQQKLGMQQYVKIAVPNGWV
ncbi:tryptophan halogenase family protein [Kangiella sp. TOML190]|uniref:tryptophan halogenase family protein n=1 Tax=Kangiella sp. TOML190 TaxID=2931351 RepID=UPI00203AD1C3|nr:tryptophan halogenase family protein [Kangiella sp. TOML190]